MYNSISKEKEKSSFDFYILSDTEYREMDQRRKCLFELVKG